MPKLFIAIALPPAVTAELAVVQPPRAAGVRLVREGQMHLTLHYLGPANLAGVATALEEVAVASFPLVIEGVGQFPSAGGAVTLWAGVRDSPELHGLHAAVAAALAPLGFRPEARPYAPHVTLARCEPKAAARVVDDFLFLNAALSLPPFTVESFGLYSSQTIDGSPAYRRERSFPLHAPEDGGAA